MRLRFIDRITQAQSITPFIAISIFYKALSSTAVLFFLLTLAAGPALAEIGTNPPSGNPGDYSGSGDWLGTNQNDQLTNESGARIDGSINGLLGSDTITNAGDVTGTITGSGNNQAQGVSGSNHIINSGSVNGGFFLQYLRQLQWRGQHKRRLQHHNQLRKRPSRLNRQLQHRPKHKRRLQHHRKHRRCHRLFLRHHEFFRLQCRRRRQQPSPTITW